MKTVTKVCRFLLGLMMLVFGLNGFFQFMPMPEPSQAMGKFMGALAETGYMFQLISLVEAVAGLLLLVNVFTPLMLIVLFTVLFNALLAHLFLDLPGIGGAAVGIILNVYLFFAYKEKYVQLVRKN